MNIEQLAKELNEFAEACKDSQFNAVAFEGKFLQILTCYKDTPVYYRFTPIFLEQFQEVVGRFQIVIELYETSFLGNWIKGERDYVKSISV